MSSEEESEECDSSSSSIEIKVFRNPRLPHIPLNASDPSTEVVAVNAHLETLPTFVLTPCLELDLGQDQSNGFGELAASNNAQFIASNESSLIVDLTDQAEKDVDDPAIESEEYSSNRSSVEIVPKSDMHPLPRVATFKGEKDILDEMKDLWSFQVEAADLEQRLNLKTLPGINTDSPQESEELNSSVSSVNISRRQSVSLAPRPAQVNQGIEMPSLEDKFLKTLSMDGMNLGNGSPAGTYIFSFSESEEFKSSTSSIEIAQVNSIISLKPRKIEEDVKCAAETHLLNDVLYGKTLDDSKHSERVNDESNALNRTSKVLKSPEVKRSPARGDMAVNGQSPILNSSVDTKDQNDKFRFRRIKPRNSAMMDSSVRFSRKEESSSSSSMESDSDDADDADDDADDDEKVVKNQVKIQMESSSKYFRFYVSKPVPKPKYSSVLDDIAFYFALYDQKCYFSGFLYKRNELGIDGRCIDKKHTLRQHGTVERGGEWVKYWAEIVGRELLLWKAPFELQRHIYPTDSKNDPMQTQHQNLKGIDGLIHAELLPSLDLIEAIKLKSTPFILQLTDVSTESYNEVPDHCKAEIIPPPAIPFTSFFSLSNQGLNKFSFASPSIVTSNLWIKAIQLSVFENDQINFVLSIKLLKEDRYLNVWTDLCIHPFSCGLKNRIAPFEGSIQARHAIDNQKVDYFCIISQVLPEAVKNRKDKRKSNIFGRPVNDLPDTEEIEDDTKGQILLYQDEVERARGHRPLIKIEDIYSAFLVWPKAKNLADNDLVTSIKVYGKISYEIPVESKKRNKARMSWFDREKPLPAENQDEMLLDAISRTGESYFFFYFKNTQESLRFLVSLWNAFGIETSIDRCIEREKIWQDPSPCWGTLCLKLDELVGDVILTDRKNSFNSFTVMMNDKLIAFNAGLLEEWQRRMNSTIDFHDSIESEEVRLKGEALIDSAQSLPKNCALPVWLKEEFFRRKIPFDDKPIQSPSRDTVSKKALSPQRIVDMNGDISPVGIKLDMSSDRPTPPPRGVTQAISSPSSPEFPDLKAEDKKTLVNGARVSSPLATKNESSESSSSSSSEDLSLEPTNQGENSRLDLMRTVPKGLNVNIQDLISRWTAEEVSRFQDHVAWISKESENQHQTELSQGGNTDNFIFDSKSLLGTGFQPRRKKEVIHGPLISAIVESEENKNKSGNRASVMPSTWTNDDIHGQSSKEMMFQDGLLGQKKVNTNITAGYGPLIYAIPINKEEVKAPHTLDQGLLGKMQSREAYIKSKMAVKDTSSARQSIMNPLTTAANQNAYQSYYGYPNTTHNAPNQSTPQSLNMNNLQQTYSYSPYQYPNQGMNSPLPAGYASPAGYMPLDYQQALMYQQYMYALESQNKSKQKKKKKKDKKKDKKKKKKDSSTPVMPFQMIQYPQGYFVSTFPESTGQGSSEIIAPLIESSSEESEESELS